MIGSRQLSGMLSSASQARFTRSANTQMADENNGLDAYAVNCIEALVVRDSIALVVSARAAGARPLKIAVMGCVVNGPGESRHADIAISLPGACESPVAPVYVDGKEFRTLKGGRIKEGFIDILEGYVKERYSRHIQN